AAIVLAMNAAAAHEGLTQGLGFIHSALRRSLETIIRVSANPIPERDRAGFVEFCERFTALLRTHHEGEEEIVFPKLTHAAARSSMPDMRGTSPAGARITRRYSSR